MNIILYYGWSRPEKALNFIIRKIKFDIFIGIFSQSDGSFSEFKMLNTPSSDNEIYL